jgi:hypothetical protein
MHNAIESGKMKDESQIKAILIGKIIREALKEVDLIASYAHYQIFNEIKIIYKQKEEPRK